MLTATIMAALVLALVPPAPAAAVNGDAGVIATVIVTASPTAAAVNTVTDRVYVVSQGTSTATSGTLTVISGTDSSVIATLPVGANPSDVVVNESTNTIYVVNNVGNSVSVVDGATNAVAATIAITNPLKAALDAGRSRLYVTSSSGVTAFDTSKNTQAASVSRSAYGIAVNTSTNRLYVGNLDTGSGGSVTVLDAADLTAALATISVSGGPNNMAVDETTNRIYVASSSGGPLSVIAGATNTVVGTIALAAAVASATEGLSVDPGRNRLYVAHESASKLAIIDTTADANTILAQITVGTFPQDAAVNTTTDRVYVPNASSNTLSVVGTLADTTPPSITAVSDTPDPFSPDGDLTNDTTRISYTLSEAAFVQVQILDASGAFQRILVSQEQSPGAKFIDWNGSVGAAPGPFTTGPAGTYTYQITARDDANNLATSTGTTTIEAAAVARPDLVVTAFTAPAVATPGGTANYTWTIKNQGTATADAVTTAPPGPPFVWGDQVWLSISDSSIAGATAAGGRVAQRSLAPGESYDSSFSATIPSSVAPGKYYFILQTDNGGQITESNESNNLSLGVPVTVTSGTVTVAAEVREDLNGNGVFDAGEPFLTVPRIDIWRLDATGARIEPPFTALNSPNLSVSGIAAGSFVIQETDPAGYSSTSPNSVTVTVAAGATSTTVFLDAPAITTATLSPASLDFGTRAVGGPLSEPQVVTISNTGGSTLTITGATFAPFGPLDWIVAAGGGCFRGAYLAALPCFEIQAEGTPCTSTLNAGASCVFVVAFQPQGAGDRSTTLTIAANVAGGSLTLGLSGRGGGLSGIARCGETTLPGATVELMSGSVVVATDEANSDGVYVFSDVAANATYTVRITGSVLVFRADTEVAVRRFITCGVTVTIGADGSATAPAGTTIPNRLNHTWPTAFDVTQGGVAGPYTRSLTDYIFTEGQSTWFKFPVRQGQHVTVNVTNLPADYSVTLYKDIRALYQAQQALLSGGDPLANVDVIDGSVAPDALSPDALSPDALSPDALSPDALSPDALSPDALSPDALSPDALSPDALSPDALSPDALSPDALSPDALSPEIYASAQMAALIGVSAHVGLSPEKIGRNTWENTGYFYVRVRGHNGAFEPSAPFTLTVTTIDSACAGVALPTFPTIPTNGFDGMKTVILTNSARLGSDSVFRGKLDALAVHGRVQGVVVDLAGPANAAYAAWDAPNARLCPAAANAIAQGIRSLIGAYRAQYPTIEHVVLVGGDSVIPFFRTPDQSGLGNERDYAPPVADSTPSQASLKLGYVLTQDPYGALTPFSRYDHELYIAELGVGRLVETPAQITPVIDAFLLPSGGIITPQRALVTGYDFLSDAAAAIGQDLVAGGVPTDDDLVQPVGDGPTAPTAWTADQLRAKLFAGPRADIVALNGHFSANRALAADYATRLGSDEIAAVTDGRFRNTLVLSTGCHSGYNIVDGHAVPLTQPLDFPQAFALQGATLVGGTGYQYGDTDFIKYSELILASFVRELRYGNAPVTVGAALANAKRAYVSQLPALRGIDEKALAEATLYGLPMTAVDLPAPGIARPGAPLTIAPTALSDTLAAVIWSPSYTLQRNEVTLTELGGTGTSTAVYYDIDGNVAVSPGTPVLPLLAQNVARDGTAARGAVLLSANYHDELGVLPFTDVATTEVRGAHAQYTAEVFTPVRPFDLNHFAGTTLVTTPFQFRSDGTAGLGTARTITQPRYKIYYSSRTDAAGILASSPVVYAVHLVPVAGGVRVDVIAGASAAVGIAEIFATYTVESGAPDGAWAPLALVEDPGTTVGNAAGFVSTYRGTIATTDPAALRVLVQAAAGNGLVTWATNNGAFYRVVQETATTRTPKAATTLVLVAANGTYLGTAAVSATLTSGGAPLVGRTVAFRSGDTRIDAQTGLDGVAEVALPLLSSPGVATVSVGFAEDATHLASGADATIQIARAPTSFAALTLAPIRLGSSAVIATLRAGGRDLNEQPVTISGGGHTLASFSDGYGRVRFDTADGFPAGAYEVTVTYAGNDRYFAAPPLTALVAVYDVDASVTAGGWIDTAGTHSNFSLTARYKDGLPRGNLQFRAGDQGHVFRATSVDWLAAGGGTATIYGAGTLNGLAGYRFRVVIVDGAADRFEISIWNAGGNLVYSAANTLGGGNVTVR